MSSQRGKKHLEVPGLEKVSVKHKKLSGGTRTRIGGRGRVQHSSSPLPGHSGSELGESPPLSPLKASNSSLDTTLNHVTNGKMPIGQQKVSEDHMTEPSYMIGQDSPVLRKHRSRTASLTDSVATTDLSDWTASIDDLVGGSPARGGGNVSPVSSQSSFNYSVDSIKRRYKTELWSAIKSDYRCIMDQELIETCKSTETDLSMDSDDCLTFTPPQGQGAELTFKEFMTLYMELSDWLHKTLERAPKQGLTKSEHHLNQILHTELLEKGPSHQSFVDSAHMLMSQHPQLRGEVRQQLLEINKQWAELEGLVQATNGQLSRHNVLQDIETDLSALTVWLDKTELSLKSLSIESNWTTEHLKHQLQQLKATENEAKVNLHIIDAVLTLCDRLTTDMEQSATHTSAELLHKRCHEMLLLCMEWIIKIEECIKHGIIQRQRSAAARWTMDELSDVTSQDEDSPAHACLSDPSSAEDVPEFSRRTKPVAIGYRSRERDPDADSALGRSFSDPSISESISSTARKITLNGLSTKLKLEPVVGSTELLSESPHDEEDEEDQRHVGDVRGVNDNSIDYTDGHSPVSRSVDALDDLPSCGTVSGRLRRVETVDLKEAFILGAEQLGHADPINRQEGSNDVGYSSESHSTNEDAAERLSLVNETFDDYSEPVIDVMGGPRQALNPIPEEPVESLLTTTPQKPTSSHLWNNSANLVQGGSESNEKSTSSCAVDQNDLVTRSSRQSSAVTSAYSSAAGNGSISGPREAMMSQPIRSWASDGAPPTEDELSESMDLPLDEVPVVYAHDSVAVKSRSLDSLAMTSGDERFLRRVDRRRGASARQTSAKSSSRRANRQSAFQKDHVNVQRSNGCSELGDVSSKASNVSLSCKTTSVADSRAKDDLAGSSRSVSQWSQDEHSGAKWSQDEKSDVDNCYVQGRYSLSSIDTPRGSRARGSRYRRSQRHHGAGRRAAGLSSCDASSEATSSGSEWNCLTDDDSSTSWLADDLGSRRTPPAAKKRTHLESVDMSSSVISSDTECEDVIGGLNDQSDDDDVAAKLRRVSSKRDGSTVKELEETLDAAEHEDILSSTRSNNTSCDQSAAGGGGDLLSCDLSAITGVQQLAAVGSWSESLMTSLRAEHKQLSERLLAMHVDHVSGTTLHDPLEYDELKSVCDKNLKQLDSAANSLQKNLKMGNKKLLDQVHELSKRWAVLRGEVELSHEECDSLSSLYRQLFGIEKRLQLLTADLKLELTAFNEQQEILQTVELIQNIQESIDSTFKEIDDLDTERSEFMTHFPDISLVELTENIGNVRQAATILRMQCAEDVARLELALYSWRTLVSMEQELSDQLAEERRQLGCLTAAHSVLHFTDADRLQTCNELEAMKCGLVMYADRVGTMRRLLLELLCVCSAHTQQQLQAAVQAIHEQLTSLTDSCQQLINALSAKPPSSSPEQINQPIDDENTESHARNLEVEPMEESTTDNYDLQPMEQEEICGASCQSNVHDQSAARSCDVAQPIREKIGAESLVTDDSTVGRAPGRVAGHRRFAVLTRLMRYALPVPLAAALVLGSLYMLDPDGTIYNSLCGYGITINPELQYVRGPPPT